MDTDVTKYHSIGIDPNGYHDTIMVEAVTLRRIEKSELIGRYNLLLTVVHEQAQRIAVLERCIYQYNRRIILMSDRDDQQQYYER